MLTINSKAVIKLVIQSYGMKSGKPLPKADLYFDCRCVVDGSSMPDHAQPSGTGAGKPLQSLVEKLSPLSVQGFINQLREGLDRIPTRRADRKTPYSDPFIVLCMCAHGVHRSVAIKNILTKTFRADGYNVVME